jgi:hypothetical protein
MFTVSFFDDVPAPPPPPEPPPFERKPWMGPPPGWVGGWVPWHIVLVRTPDVYSAITEVSAFPDGVSLRVSLRVRPGVFDVERPGPPHMFMRMFPRQGGALFGIGYADGRKAVPGRPTHPGGDDFEGPLLMPRGGGGGGEEWNQSLWLWPLPPPGPLRFVSSWEELGVAEHEVVMDAAELVEASQRAEKLWDVSPEDMRRRGGRGSASAMHTFLLSEPPGDEKGSEGSSSNAPSPPQ